MSDYKILSKENRAALFRDVKQASAGPARSAARLALRMHFREIVLGGQGRFHKRALAALKGAA